MSAPLYDFDPVRFDRGRRAFTSQVRSVTERSKRLAEAQFRASADPAYDLRRPDHLGAKAITLSASIAAAQRIVQRLTSSAMSARVNLKKPVPLDPSFLLRNGIDKSIEYQRPYRVAAQQFQNGMTRSDAIEAGVKRLNALAAVDIQMTKLRQSRLVLDTAGIMFYRRRTTGDNPCSLCEIAATKIYATNELMPIHTHCSCEIDPIDLESGKSLSELQAEADAKAAPPSRNNQQQKRIGELLDAGAPMSELRDLTVVREHGEIGPMLTWKHQQWVGPDEIAKLRSVEVKAFRAAHEDGGITIDLEGNQPSEGFAFAPRKDTEFHKPLAELTIEDIDKYVDDHFDLLSEKGNHLGLWVEKDEAYIDVSQVGAADASTIERAQGADQLGVFDLSEFNTIDVGVIEDGRYVKLGEAADLSAEYRRKVAGADQSGSQGGVSEISSGAWEPQGVAPAGYEHGIAVPEHLQTDADLDEWDGPPVAPPADTWDDFATLTDMHWQHVEFDDFKGFVRQGVRRAIENGYKGLEAEADYIGVDLEDAHAMRVGAEDLMWATTDEWFDLEGQELAARAVHAEPTKLTLYRGMGMRAEHIDTLEEGDQLSLPASSFGGDPDTARTWAKGHTFWKSGDYEGEPVVIELEAGAKTAVIRDGFVRDSISEDVAFGRFEITGIRWEPAEVGNRLDKVTTVITVRQVSLREKPIAAAAAADPNSPWSRDAFSEGAVTTGTGEYTIIKKAPKPENVISTEYPYEAAAQLYSRNPQLESVAFHDTMAPRVADDIATTLDGLLDKYPQSKLKMVRGNKILPESRYAEVEVWQQGLATERSMTKTQMTFNRAIMSSEEALERDYQHDIKLNFHSSKDGYRAAVAVTTHEFGHTLDAAGSYRASAEASRALKDAFLQLNPEMREWAKSRVAPIYDQWLKDNLSGYSFKYGQVNPAEALAEAFAVVELDPDNATPGQKALHRLLVEKSTLPERLDLNAPGWNNGGSTEKVPPPSKTVAAQEKKRRAKEKAEGVTEGGEKHKSLVERAKDAASEAVSFLKDYEIPEIFKKVRPTVMSATGKRKAAKVLAPEELSTNVLRYDLEDVVLIAPPVRTAKDTGDWVATWKQLPDIIVNPDGGLSDPILERNLTKVLLKAMDKEWIMKRGLEWYPVEFGDFVKRELELHNWINPYTGKRFTSFEEAIDAASAYAINAPWPRTMADFHEWMAGRPPKGSNTESANKASVGGGTYWLDKVEKEKSGDKIKDFSENGKGNRDTSTTDRHMARIALGTSNSDYAGGMLGAGSAGSYIDPKTGKKVTLSGYERISQAIDRVAKAHNLFPDQAQASIWIEFFGIEAAHGLPPTEVIELGTAGINQWVRKKNVEFAREMRAKLGIDEDMFVLAPIDGRSYLAANSLERFPPDVGAQMYRLSEMLGDKPLPEKPTAAAKRKAKAALMEQLAPLGIDEGTFKLAATTVKVKDKFKGEDGFPFSVMPEVDSPLRLRKLYWDLVSEEVEAYRAKQVSEPVVSDPLLDLLDGKTADSDYDTIMELIGLPPESKPKPIAPEPKPEPIPGVRPGQERWYTHLKEQEDKTDTAHLFLPTTSVNRYREYDRTEAEYATLRKAIAEDGVRLPLWISTDGKKAMLVEGNHRLAVAKELGISELPVRVTYNEEVLRNEGRDPVELTGPLKEWVEANLDELKRKAREW